MGDPLTMTKSPWETHAYATHGTPMVDAWRKPMGIPWMTHGPALDAHGSPIGDTRQTHRGPIGDPWATREPVLYIHERPMGQHYEPLVTHGPAFINLWANHG